MNRTVQHWSVNPIGAGSDSYFNCHSIPLLSQGWTTEEDFPPSEILNQEQVKFGRISQNKYIKLCARTKNKHHSHSLCS